MAVNVSCHHSGMTSSACDEIMANRWVGVVWCWPPLHRDRLDRWTVDGVSEIAGSGAGVRPDQSSRKALSAIDKGGHI